jgi:hypothetical protein
MSQVSPVPLRCWTFQWTGVRFNPGDGSGRVHLHPSGIRGWAYWRWFRWHALWNNNGRLCLQVGARQWFPEDGWRASVEDAWGRRTFKLVRGTEVALKRTYGTVGTGVMRRIDVTWDALDESMSDFFRWTATVWSDRHEQQYLLQGPWRGQPL